MSREREPRRVRNLIAASIHKRYSVGPSTLLISKRCCFIMTNMIQVCSKFHCAQAFIIDTRPDEIRAGATENPRPVFRLNHLIVRPYKGISLTQKRTLLGPYGRPMPRLGGGS